MLRIARIPCILSFILGIAACARVTPALKPVQPPVTELTRPEPATVLPLAPLYSPQVRTELETLLQLQESRTAVDVNEFRLMHTHPVVEWNRQARYWVSYYGMDPVVASRVYALTSVAQQRALDALVSEGGDISGRKPGLLDDRVNPIGMSVNPFESAVLIGATEPVFLYLFPDTPQEIQGLFDEARRSLLLSGNILPSDLKAADSFGGEIGERLVNERMGDGASKAREFDPLPAGDGIWKPDPFRVTPEQPNWGRVTPWLMASPDQFRAPPPPEFGSVAFQTAVEEVRLQQAGNTQAQLAIAHHWADKRFTATPPGHWNEIAVELIRNYGLSERDSVHVLSALNMGLMDAGIACWDSKYHYLVVRPWQADPQISALVGYPNHPSYPSGHSCYSAVSAEVLSYFFPAEHDRLWQMAEEASISRFYGGIHYRFDLAAGQNLGRQVGELAGKFAKGQSWIPFIP